MARENARRQRVELSDRARLHAAHDAFAPVPLQDLHHYCGPLRRDFASTAIAMMCAQALVVGALLLLEAVLSNASPCDSASAVNCKVEAAQISRRP